MIDTLKLHLRDYSIDHRNNLTVQPSTYNAGTGEVLGQHSLFSTEGGGKHSGAKAYLNTEKLNLTISPFGKDGSMVGCWVQFSVPKVHNGENYYPVGEGGARAVINLVEKELWENGIRTNLQNAEMSRIDTFKNIETEEHFTSYSNLFTLLKAKRAIKRDYGTTFLVHNTQQEFCIYSKNEEMKHRGMDVSGYPENTMRFEHRLLNKKKVSSVLGFSAVGDLFKGGYQVLKEKEMAEWKKSLFSSSVDDVVIMGAKALEFEMRNFKDGFGLRWFQEFLVSYGAYHLVSVAGVEVVKLALQNVEGDDGDRTKVYRAVQRLETAKRRLEMGRKANNSEKTLSQLYKELQYKLLSGGV